MTKSSICFTPFLFDDYARSLRQLKTPESFSPRLRWEVFDIRLKTSLKKSMENALPSDALAFMEPISSGLLTLAKAIALAPLTPKLYESRLLTDKTVAQLEAMLQVYLPILNSIGSEEGNRALFQAQIFAVWTLKEMRQPLKNILNISQKLPLQKQESVENLAELVTLLDKADQYEKKIAAISSFPLDKSIQKWKIGSQKLSMPLHLYIENCEDGKHATCLEIPQLYGYGDTENKALEMLDNEILSMIDDLNDGYQLSPEFQALKIFLDTVLFNAKQRF